MSSVRVNHMWMNVLVEGEGPPVLLVHGFPDTHAVWRRQMSALVEAGYRVIAPDTRGCGSSEMSLDLADYRVANLVADLIALLDHLGIAKVRLVAHDWGAVIAWQLVLDHPERVEHFIPMSVGHPNAYAHDGLWQKLKGYYVYLMQLRGLAEALCRVGDWLLFRLMTRYPEEFPLWREQLRRPGRLTAGMNYYRANFAQLLFADDQRRTAVPVSALWSSGDLFLTERQMTSSQAYVDGPWRYTRIDGANHWMQLNAAERVTEVLLAYLKAPGDVPVP